MSMAGSLTLNISNPGAIGGFGDVKMELERSERQIEGELKGKK